MTEEKTSLSFLCGDLLAPEKYTILAVSATKERKDQRAVFLLCRPLGFLNVQRHIEAISARNKNDAKARFLELWVVPLCLRTTDFGLSEVDRITEFMILIRITSEIFVVTLV